MSAPSELRSTVFQLAQRLHLSRERSSQLRDGSHHHGCVPAGAKRALYVRRDRAETNHADQLAQLPLLIFAKLPD